MQVIASYARDISDRGDTCVVVIDETEQTMVSKETEETAISYVSSIAMMDWYSYNYDVLCVKPHQSYDHNYIQLTLSFLC